MTGCQSRLAWAQPGEVSVKVSDVLQVTCSPPGEHRVGAREGCEAGFEGQETLHCHQPSSHVCKETSITLNLNGLCYKGMAWWAVWGP